VNVPVRRQRQTELRPQEGVEAAHDIKVKRVPAWRPSNPRIPH
jgi:hypothetical protein